VFFAGRRLIDEPKQLTDRPNACRRYLTVAGADRGEDRRLFSATRNATRRLLSMTG
jgi:hypothetical protein